MRYLAPLAVIASTSTALAGISFTGVNDSYSYGFDDISAQQGASWANDFVFESWNLFTSTGAVPATINQNAGGTWGNNGTGSFYSFGLQNDLDRALGGLGSGGTYFGSPASGAIAGYIAFSVTNGTGVSLPGALVGFDGEQWRNSGAADAQTMVLEYGFGATFASVSSWTAPGGNFDWSSPVNGGTAGPVNGNVAGLVAGRGGWLNLNWAAGDTLWIRWIERNDTATDHGLGIDNFTISVPAPGAAALLGIGLLVSRRRR